MLKQHSKKKIDQDFIKDIILGGCNAGLAYDVLSEEIDIGLLLPYNIIDYKHPWNRKTVIGVIDSEIMVQATDRKDLVKFSKKVREKVQSAIDAFCTRSVYLAEKSLLFIDPVLDSHLKSKMSFHCCRALN